MNTKKRKLIILGSLLLVLVILAVYFVFFFRTQRLLPLPGVNRAPSYVDAVYEPIEQPVSIEINQNTGMVYLTDAGNKPGVHIFDSSGNFIKTFGKIDSKRKKLQVPLYIAIDSNDNVYISDRMYASIFIFNKDGVFLKEFLPEGKKNYSWNPMGIAVDKNDNIYVTDVGKHQIYNFNKDGKLIKKFGTEGYTTSAMKDGGKFYFPNKIAVSSTGDIYIADGNNSRIQVFDKNGNFKKILLKLGAMKGFALDEEYGKIYVADVFGHKIEAFGLDGKKLQTFGSQGMDINQLDYPSDVALAKNGTMYIADSGNSRFLIWKKPLEPKEAVKTVWPYLAATIALIIALIAAFLTWTKAGKKKALVKQK